MNTDIFEGKWKQFKGSIKEHWGELTDDEVDRIEGKSERLVGLLQERYGYEKAEAERQVNEFMAENRQKA
ncbi:MAG: CsbD family protein [Chloroflexota bacterium]